MTIQQYNTPGFMDGIGGTPPAGSQLLAQMKNDLAATPNSLYNQSAEKKQGLSFKDWIKKQQQPGGILNQAEKKYGPMFQEWMKGKFNLSATDAGNSNFPPSTLPPPPAPPSGQPPAGGPAKEPMSMAAKIGIGIGIALAVGAVIGGIIYFS